MLAIERKNIFMKSILFPFVTVFCITADPLKALQLDLTYTSDGQVGSIPAGDPNGTQLMVLANAAKAYWEDIIEDNQTITLTIRYDNAIGAGFIGFFTLLSEANGRPSTGRIDIRGNTQWYYDPTPNNHSEFLMGDVLFRNTTLANQANFAGNVPGVLEVGFGGPAAPGAPALAQTATDLYSVILHEMGHAIGMTNQLTSCTNQIADNDFDIIPSMVNGNNFSVLTGGNTGAHTACTICIMNPAPTGGVGVRRLPSVTDVLALANCPNPPYTQIDLPRQDFYPGGTSDWNTASNWVGNRVPNSSSTTSCRHGIDIPGDPLLSLSGPAFCQNLLLSNTTRLRTFAHKLDVGLEATLEHDGNLPAPEIFVEAGGELEATDLLINGGEVDVSGGLVDLADDLILSGETLGRKGSLVGYGNVEVDGALVNNGRIAPSANNTLVFNSPANAPWDLDGASGNGEVLAIQGSLNFATGAVSDAFDGLLQIEDPHTVTFGEAWTLGAGGLIQLNGGAPSEATLAGALLTAATGDIQVTGNSRITAPVQFGGTLEMIVAANGQLMLDGLATVSGGAYLLGAGANVEFNNSSTFSDGAWIIPSTANLRFDGAHTLQGGSYAGLGTLRFNGNTTIGQAVTINCEVLDFDGGGSLTKAVHVNADLTINSDQIDLADNRFDSTLNINQSSSELIVNGPESWVMNGILNHFTNSVLYFPSVSGVPFLMSGTTNVSGYTRWDAIATITGTVNLPAVADGLALNGGDDLTPNRIEGGSIAGSGRLRAANARLSGFGTISSGLDFATGSSLLADDGLLGFTGSFLTVPPLLGTAAADGILDIGNNWTLPASSQLALNGGFVQGATVTNQGLISGHGEFRGNKIVNNGSISAGNGQTLVINTTFAADLDGTGTDEQVASHTINAIDGNLQIVSAPLDVIGATVNIAPGRSMTFLGGWTLDVGGTLNMTGNTSANSALLAGTSSTLNGNVHLDDDVRITTTSVFGSDSSTVFADGDAILHLGNNGTINAGAAFSGPGRLVIGGGYNLTLGNGSTVGVSVSNDSSNLEIGVGPAQASVAEYDQNNGATMVIDISDRPNTTNWDKLTVSGNADLSGRLEVVFNAGTAVACDTWKIINAGSLTGGFTQFSVAGVPAGHRLLKFETPTGVYLTLSMELTYAEWALSKGLQPGSDAVDQDPDGDLMVNALEMLLGTDPEAAEFGLLPGPGITTVNGVDYLSLELPVHAESTPVDLEYGAVRSTDLENWSAGNITVWTSGFDEVSCKETKIYRSNFPFGSLPSEFLRIKVVEAAP